MGFAFPYGACWLGHSCLNPLKVVGVIAAANRLFNNFVQPYATDNVGQILEKGSYKNAQFSGHFTERQLGFGLAFRFVRSHQRPLTHSLPVNRRWLPTFVDRCQPFLLNR